MSSCCGGKCGCGSSCSCGSGCNGCGKYTDLNISETTSNTQTFIAGVAPVKMHYEESEISFGSENGCKCGDNCTCNPCTCK